MSLLYILFLSLKMGVTLTSLATHWSEESCFKTCCRRRERGKGGGHACGAAVEQAQERTEPVKIGRHRPEAAVRARVRSDGKGRLGAMLFHRSAQTRAGPADGG
jgi:hypothetical protein